MSERAQKQIDDGAHFNQGSSAQQEYIQGLVRERQNKMKVPKFAWVFMGLVAAAFFGVIVLFMMSFNPSTKDFVDKAIGSFKVF